MDNLEVIELYENKSNKNELKEFINKNDSTLRVKIEKNILSLETEWLDFIENTLPYIDNIFRSPNRFIVNEEEIVKVEQTKKITIETIKHLSKNTNFIQDLDEETGDVIPSKLLNVRKEESYDTYENRLIYTLIQNTKYFLKVKKEEILASINNIDDEKSNKNNKSLEYNAETVLKEEKININLNLNSKQDFSGEVSKEKIKALLLRIEEVEKNIRALSDYETYKVIDAQHISLIKEPIRRTNVVLKNVNFQYAMKLWAYLRDNTEGIFDEEEENKDYMDNGGLKKLVDETFFLQYLTMKTLDEDGMENESTQQEIQEIAVEQMIEKMVDMDVEISEEQLQKLISQKYEVIKYKKIEVIKEIQQIFKKHIDKYEEQIERRRN